MGGGLFIGQSVIDSGGRFAYLLAQFKSPYCLRSQSFNTACTDLSAWSCVFLTSGALRLHASCTQGATASRCDDMWTGCSSGLCLRPDHGSIPAVGQSRCFASRVFVMFAAPATMRLNLVCWNAFNASSMMSSQHLGGHH